MSADWDRWSRHQEAPALPLRLKPIDVDCPNSEGGYRTNLASNDSLQSSSSQLRRVAYRQPEETKIRPKFHHRNRRSGFGTDESRYVTWDDENIPDSNEHQHRADPITKEDFKNENEVHQSPTVDSKLNPKSYRDLAKSMSLEEHRQLKTPVLDQTSPTSTSDTSSGHKLTRDGPFVLRSDLNDFTRSPSSHFRVDKSLLMSLLEQIVITQTRGEYAEKALRDYRLRIDMLNRLKSLPLDHVVRRASEACRKGQAHGSSSQSQAFHDESVEEQAMRTLIECCNDHLDQQGLTRVQNYVEQHRSEYSSPCLLATILKERDHSIDQCASSTAEADQTSSTTTPPLLKGPFGFVPDIHSQRRPDLGLVPDLLPLTCREAAIKHGCTYLSVLSFYNNMTGGVSPQHEPTYARLSGWYMSNCSGLQGPPLRKKRGFENDVEGLFLYGFEESSKRVAHLKHHQAKRDKIPVTSTSGPQRDYEVQLRLLEEANRKRLEFQRGIEKDRDAIRLVETARAFDDKHHLENQLRIILSDHYNKLCVLSDRQLSRFKDQYGIREQDVVPSGLCNSFARILAHVHTWAQQRLKLIYELFGELSEPKGSGQPTQSGRSLEEGEEQDVRRQILVLEIQNMVKKPGYKRNKDEISYLCNAPSWQNLSQFQRIRERQLMVRGWETIFKEWEIMPDTWPSSCEALEIPLQAEKLTSAQESVVKLGMWTTIQNSVCKMWLNHQEPLPSWSLGRQTPVDLQNEMSMLICERQRLATEVDKAEKTSEPYGQVFRSMVYASFVHSMYVINKNYNFISRSTLRVRLEAYKRIIHLFDFMIMTMHDDFRDPFVYNNRVRNKSEARYILGLFASRSREIYKKIFTEREDSAWQPLAQFTLEDYDVDRSTYFLERYIVTSETRARPRPTLKLDFGHFPVSSTLPEVTPSQTQQQKETSGPQFKFIQESPSKYSNEDEDMSEDEEEEEEEEQADGTDYGSWTTDHDDEDNQDEDENENNREESNADRDDEYSTMTQDGHSSVGAVTGADGKAYTDYEDYIRNKLSKCNPADVIMWSCCPDAESFDKLDATHSCPRITINPYTSVSAQSDTHDDSEIGQALFVRGAIPHLDLSEPKMDTAEVTREESEDGFVMVPTTTASDEEDAAAYDILSVNSPLSGADTDVEIV